jgi:methionyl-tRNA synthetase
MQAPAKRRKKAVRKTETKVPKTKKKKKKVIKRKGTGSPQKSKTSKMKPAPSPAKKKKGVTPKKKTTSRKTKKKTAKGKVSSRFQNSRSSVDAKMNVPIGKQVPQLQLPIAEAEMVSEKSSSAIASPEAGIEKNGTTEM